MCIYFTLLSISYKLYAHVFLWLSYILCEKKYIIADKNQIFYHLNSNKKLSYCWETVRRNSMPRIAEMDVEMTT